MKILKNRNKRTSIDLFDVPIGEAIDEILNLEKELVSDDATDIELSCECWDGGMEVYVYYKTYETDKEEASRILRERKAEDKVKMKIENKEAQERDLLKKLKAKYDS